MKNRPLCPASSVAVLLVLIAVFCPLPPHDAVQAAEITTAAAAELADDFDRHSLLQAARRQAEYLRLVPPGSHFQLGARVVSADLLRASIETFIEIVEQESSPQTIARRVQEEFLLLPTGTATNPTPAGAMLVTGYFHPVIDGSLEPTPRFVHPLYRLPPDLIARQGGTSIGRLDNGRLVPYWSRREIETRDLLAGNELVYLDDPIEAFILHIQGSGTVRLRDGSRRALRFAGSNGHPYHSIGRLLVEAGRLTLAQATLPGIVDYLRTHPGEVRPILHANPRFIFFAWGEPEAVRGSTNIALTAGRSVAIDPSVVPLGSLAYLKSRQPLIDRQGQLQHWRPLDRFVFPQDSGAAIKGGRRVDLFLGDSEGARQAAGLMREQGTLYILVQKSTAPRRHDD